MSALSETSLTSMKAAFPAAPDPIQGIPTLVSINLMLHICRCLQTQKTPASATMNMLFCAASPGLYSFFTTEAYPTTFFPFPDKHENNKHVDYDYKVGDKTLTHHDGAVCLPSGMVSISKHTPTLGASAEGVGQGHRGRV